MSARYLTYAEWETALNAWLRNDAGRYTGRLDSPPRVTIREATVVPFYAEVQLTLSLAPRRFYATFHADLHHPATDDHVRQVYAAVEDAANRAIEYAMLAREPRGVVFAGYGEASLPPQYSVLPD